MSSMQEQATALTVLGLAEHLERLTGSDLAARAAGLEALLQFRKGSKMKWSACLPNLWLTGSVAVSPGRLAIADENVPPHVRGTIGSVKIITSPMGLLVFATILSVDLETPTEWGPLLFCQKESQKQIASAEQNVFDVSVTQPNAEARAARRGGLRPIGVIVKTASADSEPALPAGK